MSSYQTFTTSRLTEADPASLLALLRAQDGTVGVQHFPGSPIYVIKKETFWTAPQTTFTQTQIDTAPTASPQLFAQTAIDAMSLFQKAIILTILDQFNLVRSKLAPPLPAITVDQMIAAVRAKAGTL